MKKKSIALMPSIAADEFAAPGIMFSPITFLTLQIQEM
jgi:hypothetical protein